MQFGAVLAIVLTLICTPLLIWFIIWLVRFIKEKYSRKASKIIKIKKRQRDKEFVLWEKFKKKNEQKLKDVNCPRCGDKLIFKYNPKRKKGFVGCSEYPNCKLTVDCENIDDLKSNKKREKLTIELIPALNREENLTLDAHEKWNFDDINKIQKLESIICLCKNCHQVKHYNLAKVNGKERLVKDWLKQQNGWSDEEADEYIFKKINQWKARSQHRYKIDTSNYDEFYDKALAVLSKGD